MADIEKSAILKVEVDFGDLEKNQAEISSRIAQIKNEQLKLDSATKEGQKAFRENAAQLRVLDQQLKLNQKSLNDLTAAEKANTDTTNFNNNSIKQNRELLKDLNAEYIRLQNPTKEQTANIKRLTDTLKQQEAATGNNARNVGNYAEGFREALSTFPGFTKGLDGIATGFKALSLSNPFTAILLILPPIITYLQKFESVFDVIEQVLGGVTGAIQGIVSGFSKLLTLDFAGFAKSVGDAASESFNLVKATQDLEDAEREFSVTSAKAEAQVKNLIIQSKDRTKTEQERINLLNQAAAIEKANFEQSLELAKELFRIEKAKLILAEQAGTAGDAQRNKVAEAEKNLVEVASRSADVLERIQNRLNENENEINQEREKRSEQYKAQREKEIKAEEERTKLYIEEVNKRNAAEFDNLMRLKELDKFREDLLKKEVEQTRAANFEKIRLKIEEIAETEQIRARDYQLFLESNVLEATTRQEAFEQRRIQLQEQNRITTENTKLTEEQKRNIILKNSIAIRQIDKEETQARIANQQNAANALANLSNALGETTEAGKALAVASTIISTYAAAQQAFASLSVIPVVGPALGAAAAAAAIIQGLQRVQKIQQVEVPRNTQGLATGGIVTGGVPITRANGDNRLITAKTNEVVLTEAQQQRIGGAAVLAAAGVPGFATGGPIPSINSEVQSTRQAIEQTSGLNGSNIIEAIKQLQISVSVTEIERKSRGLELQAKVVEF